MWVWVFEIYEENVWAVYWLVFYVHNADKFCEYLLDLSMGVLKNGDTKFCTWSTRSHTSLVLDIEHKTHDPVSSAFCRFIFWIFTKSTITLLHQKAFIHHYKCERQIILKWSFPMWPPVSDAGQHPHWSFFEAELALPNLVLHAKFYIGPPSAIFIRLQKKWNSIAVVP